MAATLKPRPGRECVSALVKESRRLAGLSQSEFAKQLGLTRDQVASYEYGHVAAPSSIKRKIAKLAARKATALQALVKGATPRTSPKNPTMSDRLHPSEPVDSQGKPTPADPAAANENLEWTEGVLKQIGLTAAVVEIGYSEDKPLEVSLDFAEPLGEALQVAHLGHYDTVKGGNPIRFFFYLYTSRLPSGLQFVKARLAELGILSACKIGYADTEERLWRVFYPAAVGLAG